MDPKRWDKSDYSPTPTIIEAAQSLYAGNNVREISRCHAGIDHLTKTTDAVLRLIEQARAQNTKTICFITGVAGAGKTLAGLNVVHNHGLHDDDLWVFLDHLGVARATRANILLRRVLQRATQVAHGSTSNACHLTECPPQKQPAPNVAIAILIAPATIVLQFFYSYRNATIGSTFVARRAGI